MLSRRLLGEKRRESSTVQKAPRSSKHLQGKHYRERGEGEKELGCAMTAKWGKSFAALASILPSKVGLEQKKGGNSWRPDSEKKRVAWRVSYLNSPVGSAPLSIWERGRPSHREDGKRGSFDRWVRRETAPGGKKRKRKTLRLARKANSVD